MSAKPSTKRALTHYQILRVPKNASFEQIEAAYQSGLAEVRAGLQRGVPLQHRLLEKLRLAYDILSNAENRQAYDVARRRARKPAAPAATNHAAASKSLTLRFEFTGRGGEYFRIWIVNLMLSVLTLGIYSAWAKVRSTQYFHRHTRLARHSFDYHGNPRAILPGRLAACACLLMVIAAYQYQLLGIVLKYSVPVLAALALGALALVPWLMMRSLKFKAANTSYQGLRFQHRGTYAQALAAVSGEGLLLLPTIGVWMPMWVRAMKRFRIGRLSFGGKQFTCVASVADFFRTYLFAGLMLLAPIIATMIFVIAKPAKGPWSPVWILVASVLLVAVLFIWPFLQVRLANLTWNGTTLGNYRLLSKQAFRSFWPLRMGNVMLVVLTLGLYWPWARVREAVYRARHVALKASDLEAFISQAKQNVPGTIDKPRTRTKTVSEKPSRPRRAAHLAVA